MAIKELYMPADFGDMAPLVPLNYYNFKFMLRCSHGTYDNQMEDMGGYWQFSEYVPSEPGVHDLTGLSSQDAGSTWVFKPAFFDYINDASGLDLRFTRYVGGEYWKYNTVKCEDATQYFRSLNWSNISALTPEQLTCGISLDYSTGEYVSLGGTHINLCGKFRLNGTLRFDLVSSNSFVWRFLNGTLEILED